MESISMGALMSGRMHTCSVTSSPRVLGLDDEAVVAGRHLRQHEVLVVEQRFHLDAVVLERRFVQAALVGARLDDGPSPQVGFRRRRTSALRASGLSTPIRMASSPVRSRMVGRPKASGGLMVNANSISRAAIACGENASWSPSAISMRIFGSSWNSAEKGALPVVAHVHAQQPHAHQFGRGLHRLADVGQAGVPQLVFFAQTA